MNTFGVALRVSTFGESHGKGIGCVIDGIPAGLRIDEEFIRSQMLLRQGGRNAYATPRKEADEVEIISGVFNGISTGAPIGLFIANNASKSKDYENIKDIFRPSHADFTYFHKYGIRDYRGGGRASARESALRVASGAIAKLLLKEFGITVWGGIIGVGDIQSTHLDFSIKDFERALDCEIFALDESKAQLQKDRVLEAKRAHDSVGGVALLKAFGVPIGLGEPLYYKLDCAIGALMLGLNGVKAVEIGAGRESSTLKGSEYNDCMDSKGFMSNRSGGVLGGISNGEEIVVRVYFKPTPSISLPQSTQDTQGRVQTCEVKGRHDPCIAIRGSVVAQAQLALILADLLLLNASAKLSHLKKIYT